MVLQVHATANRQRHELRPLVAVRLLTSLLILAFHKTITTRGGGWVFFSPRIAFERRSRKTDEKGLKNGEHKNVEHRTHYL